jgi:hypothetical protein
LAQLRRESIWVAMLQFRPDQKRRAPRGLLAVALLSAGAAVFAAPGLVVAQETGSLLRGEVSEAEINDDLLSGLPLLERPTPLQPKPPGDIGIPSPTFEPASRGAIPDTSANVTPSGGATAAERSIFQSNDGDDAFADELPPAPAGRPVTVAKRVSDARQKAGRPRDPAAERLAAKKKKEAESDDEEDAGTTGTVRVGTVDSETQSELDVNQPADRTAPIEGLEKPLPEEDPYRPVGIRAGNFILLPSLESGVTWSSNANSSPGGEPALLSESTLRLNIASDLADELATLDAFVNFRKTISGEEIDETRGGINGALEHELGGDWKVLGSIGYEIGPESASAPDAIEGTLNEPIEQTFAGSLGFEKDVGKLQLRLTGNVERQVFGDAELSTGGTVSQEDRNSTLVAGVLRTGYEISPALTPFVEVEYGHRFYDLDVDSNGFDRAANRMGARAGLELDMGEKFSGEFSAGWISEVLADDRLAPVSGPSVSADLAWSPVRGTIVGLNALTTVEGSTDAGDSGSILYSSEITVERLMRANLTANLSFGAGLRNYTGEDGRDVILAGEAGATYWFNRYVGLSGRLRHEELDSTLPGRDYKTNSVFLGLKLQR